MRDYTRSHGCVAPDDLQRQAHEAQAQRVCRHTPAQTYTREPCVCGRELWPPRGRGRGESLLSPRRIAAKMRAVEAMRLNVMDYTWEQIAAQLGYRTRGGAWRAVQRLRDDQAAWYRYYAARGKTAWYERKRLLDTLRAGGET